MFIKEEEARKLKCPLFITGCFANGFNTASSLDANCDGKDCPAWRWKVLPTGQKSIFGYCGLAGKPEEYTISGTN